MTRSFLRLLLVVAVVGALPWIARSSALSSATSVTPTVVLPVDVTPAVALTSIAAPPQDKAPDCKKCGSTGRVACTEHPRSECELEDAVLYCSVIADCVVCAGVGWIPCKDCSNEAARAAIEAKKKTVVSRKAVLKVYDDGMKRPLRKAESKHFMLVWELERSKVGKKWLEGHEMLHLYLKRLEDMHLDYCMRLGITDKEFAEKTTVLVWWLQQDHLDGSLRFCRQSASGGVKLLGTTPTYSICGSKQNFKDDESLYRNIVHCVAHELLSSQAPVAWIGNIKAGWADEGLAHWFEDRYFGICDTYCYQEANSNVDFKGGKFRLAMRKLIETDKTPSIGSVFEANVDTLTLPEHAAAFSYVDYLITRDGAKFNELVKKLKAKIPTREALKSVYGVSPLEFEPAWKAWVLATYPTRE